MWQDLYDYLVRWGIGIITSSAFARTVRLFISATLTGCAISNFGVMWDFLGRACTPLSSMTLTADWSSYVLWFQLANAWLPVTETFLAIAALWTFRGTFAALKVVEHIWDAVPFQ